MGELNLVWLTYGQKASRSRFRSVESANQELSLAADIFPSMCCRLMRSCLFNTLDNPPKTLRRSRRRGKVRSPRAVGRLAEYIRVVQQGEESEEGGHMLLFRGSHAELFIYSSREEFYLAGMTGRFCRMMRRLQQSILFLQCLSSRKGNLKGC